MLGAVWLPFGSVPLMSLRRHEEKARLWSRRRSSLGSPAHIVCSPHSILSPAVLNRMSFCSVQSHSQIGERRFFSLSLVGTCNILGKNKSTRRQRTHQLTLLIHYAHTLAPTHTPYPPCTHSGNRSPSGHDEFNAWTLPSLCRGD
jgi:hypothetical protein